MKGSLYVAFEGYKGEASYKKPITLKANKNLPKLSVTAMTLYPDTVANASDVRLINQTQKTDVKISDGYFVSLKGDKPQNYDVIAQSETQPMTIMALKGAKSATFKLEVGNENWIENLKIPVTCKVKIEKKPVLSFSSAAITLNKKYVSGETNPVEVLPYVKGFEGMHFTSVAFEGKDAKSTAAYESGALSLEYSDGVIKAAVKDRQYFSKNAKYSYSVQVITEQGLDVAGKLTVTVATAEPQLTLKASGSIDLLNRTGSAVTYKAGPKNYSGAIKSMELDGNNADCFTLEYSNGTAKLKAIEGKALKIKTPYQIVIKATLENGGVLTKTVNVTLKQKTPSLTADIKKITLFKSSSGVQYGQQLVISEKNHFKIKDIKLAEGDSSFSYDYIGDGKGVVFVADQATAKENKTYKLKFAVTLDDAAENMAPLYVTVQVKYCK